MYDNHDPLTALAAAAARTSRVELVSMVVNVCWRSNAVLLARSARAGWRRCSASLCCKTAAQRSGGPGPRPDATVGRGSRRAGSSGDLEQVALLAEALRASTYAGVDMGTT